jgi:hypothetical protein
MTFWNGRVVCWGDWVDRMLIGFGGRLDGGSKPLASSAAALAPGR